MDFARRIALACLYLSVLFLQQGHAEELRTTGPVAEGPLQVGCWLPVQAEAPPWVFPMVTVWWPFQGKGTGREMSRCPGCNTAPQRLTVKNDLLGFDMARFSQIVPDPGSIVVQPLFRGTFFLALAEPSVSEHKDIRPGIQQGLHTLQEFGKATGISRK